MPDINLSIENIVTPIINEINKILPNIPAAILIILVGILVIRIASRLIRFGLSLSNLPSSLVDIIVTLIDIALWVFLAIACLQFMGLNNVALAVVGSFSFVVLGISQGLADAVKDVVGGVALARDRDFSIGDHIKTGGDQKIEGVIVEMDLRRTRIRDMDGKLHVLPNAMIDRNSWTMIDRRHEIRPNSKLAKVFKKPVKRKVAKR